MTTDGQTRWKFSPGTGFSVLHSPLGTLQFGLSVLLVTCIGGNTVRTSRTFFLYYHANDTLFFTDTSAVSRQGNTQLSDLHQRSELAGLSYHCANKLRCHS